MPNEHGMRYEDVRKRILRMDKTERSGKVKNAELKRNLEHSLVNQAERRERGAGREILRELNHRQSKWV